MGFGVRARPTKSVWRITWYGVWGLGFRVQDLGFGNKGERLRVEG